MAEKIVYTIATDILKKLASTTMQQINLAVGVKWELKKLEKTLSTINAVLLDAEQKQSTSQGLRVWLQELQDVLYDFDNVLDAVAYKVLQQQLGNQRKSKLKVRHIFTSVKFRFGMGYKIREIREKLDHIASDRARFNLTEGVVDWHVMSREMTHSYVDSSDVIGRDTDKKNILHLLTCSNIDQNLSVVPIVGIGGLGKTTIVKLVYNNIEVRTCFELRMWVCVSEDFNLHKMAIDINESATKGVDCSNLPIDQLQVRLREILQDKKFLLILDDVWNEHPHKWNELRQLLINGAGGSKIVVTTRSFRVASIMGTTKPYILEGLSDEDCWSLFAKCAFREGEEKNYLNLKIIGKQIIKKCKGVPLAVRSLGSMLFMKTDERDWLLMKKSEIWRLEDNKNGILPALRLSYNQLPSHLKRCFAFCSIFPKDFAFNSCSLIGMWMSQGLIQPSIESEDLEDMGIRYIKELYSRCFFQDVSDLDDSFDGMKFKMHDLVHDLALLVTQNESYTVNNLPMPSTISDNIRHVSFYKREDVSTLFRFDLRKLWTLYYSSSSKNKDVSESFLRTCIPRLKFVRMLHIRFQGLEVLSGSVGRLNHLRYLNLCNNFDMKKLPDAICKLLHLETLNILGCSKLEGLPKDIGNLIKLRRLWITAKKIYLVPNKQIDLLTSLRDLRLCNCPNLITSNEGMQCIFPSLRTLIIYNCENLVLWPGIMKQLPALETLYIRRCEKLNLTNSANDVHYLRFTNLRSLVFSELLELKALPGWVEGCSNTLHFLSIYNCENLTTLPNWMQNLTSLNKLVISGCPKILKMPKRMPHLIKLKITNCSELSYRCNNGGEEWRKIGHIPNITIDGKDMRKMFPGPCFDLEFYT